MSCARAGPCDGVCPGAFGIVADQLSATFCNPHRERHDTCSLSTGPAESIEEGNGGGHGGQSAFCFALRQGGDYASLDPAGCQARHERSAGCQPRRNRPPGGPTPRRPRFRLRPYIALHVRRCSILNF